MLKSFLVQWSPLTDWLHQCQPEEQSKHQVPLLRLAGKHKEDHLPCGHQRICCIMTGMLYAAHTLLICDRKVMSLETDGGSAACP